MAGEQGWKFDKKKAIDNLKHPETVRFIGFVPDEDMSALYSTADVFAFPTLYEGFGIPILEAQSCGVPVLTSNCSALPEVGGEGALYVDPYDEKSIAEGLWKLLTDRELAEGLVRAGYEPAYLELSSHRLPELVSGWGRPERFFNYIVPPHISGRVITAVHDMTWLRFPKTMDKRNYRRLQDGLARSIAHSDHILTLSQSSKEEIINLMAIPEEKISIVSCAPSLSKRVADFTLCSEKFQIKKPICCM